jgi:hypothetical protein
MNTTAPQPIRRGRRIGCLGSLLVLVVGAGAFFMIVNALFAPWIYTVGGGRLLPLWQGVGEAHASSGIYTVYVWFSPSPAGTRILPSASIQGSGYICTPRGERFALRITGGASGRVWKDMDGHTFGFSAYDRPAFWQFSGGHADWRPDLKFSGRWAGPDLVMSDDGTVSRAFLPDGQLNRGPLPRTKAPALPVTFHEMNWWLAGRSCPAHP